jgi:acyl-CoA dehydrogenase
MPDSNSVRAFLDERHIDLARRLEGFTRREIEPRPEPRDDEASRVQARELLEVLGSAGWFAPIVAQDLRACALTREALAAASPLADAVFALQALGAMPILLAGATELADRWMVPTVSGKAMAAFAITEADAGSDIASLTTSARRDGGEYVLQGAKTFISNAGIADYYTVFASTDPAKGRQGISCFVVPAVAKGLRFVRPLVMSAAHPLGEIAFDECRIPASHRLGDSSTQRGAGSLENLWPSFSSSRTSSRAWRRI